VRRGESGLSAIEAIVMLAVLSLAAGVALTPMGAGIRNDGRVALARVDASTRLTGEETIRRLVQAALPVGRGTAFEGSAEELVFTSFADQPDACTAAKGMVRVRLRIVPVGSGGEIQCSAGARTGVMARWSSGRGAFSYDDGAGEWRSRTTDLDADATRVFVRFLVEGDARLAWVTGVARLPAETMATPVRQRPEGGGDLDR
jgi:hypothetical protein